MPSVRRIKLYHYPATRSARVKWMLHEVLDDDFDVQRVDLYGGEQYEAEFLGKNPNHGVPTLELSLSDGTTRHMIESGAMIGWLADAFPDARLAPPAGALSSERADYLQMLHFGSTCMDMMLWQIRVHRHLLTEDQRDARTLVRYQRKFKTEVEPQLERRLEAAPYICGDDFSAADCMVGHSVLWARVYGMCDATSVADYAARLMLRPAFQKAFADMHEFVPEVHRDSPILERFTG